MRPPTTRQFTVPVSDDAVLQAEEYLPAEGTVDPELPTIVLAHGWTLTRHAWEPVIDELLQHRPVRVVAYDQRGHGESSMGHPDRATVRLLASDLRAVIDAAAPEGPVLLGGHSMGGMTVMAYAGSHHTHFGARVCGVVLVGTAASVQGRRPIPLESFVMGVAARAPRIAPRVLVPTAVQGRLLFGRGAKPSDIKTAVAMIQRTKMPTIGQFFHAIEDHDEIESLAHFVDVPTHILVGSMDRLTPVSYARMLQDAIPSARLTVIPDLGHMLMYEATHQVTDALIEFIDAAR
ncbi:MAG TPA: alpha/beta hydrolase [Phycicoccus sp.]|nr:alpha/beta hydrolase [Phycicoccus sp.]